jgi:hypothetical protein
MATKNEYFNPILERLRAAMENAGNFAIHPGQQSQRAVGVAQDMFRDYADAARPTSALQPYMRPGVPEEALTQEQIDLLRKQQGGLLGNGQ